MYLFGHLGLGALIARPVFRKLSRAHGILDEQYSRYIFWLLIGCLLPDLIDKPLHFFSVQYSLHIPIVLGDKGIAHTLLFTCSAITLSFLLNNLTGKLISLGTATHLLLDLVGDSSHWLWFGTEAYPAAPYDLSSPKLLAYFWPFWVQEFAQSSQTSVMDYWTGLLSPPLIMWEVIGALFFFRKRIAPFP